MLPAPLRTERLLLAPYAWSDQPELTAFKADPRCWALMLGGVRTPVQTARDLAHEMRFWRSHDIGMWTARSLDGRLLGVTGLHERPDARGIALRFAFDPEARGHGLSREAAGAVLTDAHARARLTKIVAVTRVSNAASRSVLEAIGMHPAVQFKRQGEPMLQYESIAEGRNDG